MERLTEHLGNSIFIRGCKTFYANEERKNAPASNAIVRLAAYEDTMPLERAQELAHADKDGRLLELPFCVGTTLYEAMKRGIREYVVEQFSIGGEDLLIHALDKGLWYRGGRIFGLEQIGKTVFMTREEAEAALRKEKEADNAKD